MNTVNQVFSNANPQTNTPNDSSFDATINLLQSDIHLMDGKNDTQGALDDQFQDFLNGLKPYMHDAGKGTQKAFQDLEDAFTAYQKNPDLGNAKLEAALSELQANPLNLTNAQFQSDTSKLLDRFAGFVAISDTPGQYGDRAIDHAGNLMNLVTALTSYSSQLPSSYLATLQSPSFTTAYNTFAQTLVTGGPLPTSDVINALLDQIDALRASI